MMNAVGQNKRTGKVYFGNKLRDELEKGTAHI
jgi:actin-related protein 6